MKKFLVIPLKGIAALLIAQMLLLLTVFFVQSCKKTSVEPDKSLQKREVEKLNLLIKEKSSTLKSLSIKRKKFKDEGSVEVSGHLSARMANQEYYITEEYEIECEQEVKPIYNQSQNVISAYGITEQDLVEEWGYGYDPELTVELALTIAAYEALDHEHGISYMSNSMFLIKQAYANRLYDCVKTALGIEALWELWRTRALSSYAGKRVLIRAIGKVATRSLGWVGAAWAVADFVDCYW